MSYESLEDYTPWNPNKRNMAKVIDRLPEPTDCLHCGGTVSLINNIEIYGKSFGPWPWAYRCIDCGAYVGLHPGTPYPLGTLANKEMREARKVAKALFIEMQLKYHLDRNIAYAYLANALKIKKFDCHFAMFNVEMCAKAVGAITELSEVLQKGK